MTDNSEVIKILRSKPTLEGAGVSLKRVFGYYETPLFDPFLLLDHFGSDNPKDYMAGFPWHPHRGIETVTYMLSGEVEHGDSIGNRGIIGSGDVQWMTAGSGIIHQEMPKLYDGMMQGFQLWVNLPASHKMMEPRYRDVLSSTIPVVTLESGTKVKVISGVVNGEKGPVQDIVVDIEYLDVTVPESSEFEYLTNDGYTAFTYVFEGEGIVNNTEVSSNHLVLFEKGSEIKVTTQAKSIRFLLVSGEPVNEPIAWQGPIVMNTEEELQLAFKEYNSGIFIK